MEEDKETREIGGQGDKGDKGNNYQLPITNYQSKIQSPLPLLKKGEPKSKIPSLLIRRLSYGAIAICGLGLIATAPAKAQSQDAELKIGVVQRFGNEPTDELNLQASPGDRLSLKFNNGGQETQLSASSVKLEVGIQPLMTPVLQERVVLSTHRSFETAEDAAKRWQAFGIQVEIAQPEQWQVWAKRQVYDTPFLCRLLLSSIHIKGNRTAYLDSQILPQVPIVSWEVNGKRYSSKQLEVTAAKNLIKVNRGQSDRVGNLYPGQLRLQPNSYGTYTLVNDVPLEAYLRGVVPHEIGPQAPYAAVEAQAIIARTYALRNVRRFAIDNYELCADTQCQVYYGLNGTQPKSDRAVLATRGKVLTYNNQLVDALYSSTTGGVTAAFSDVWDGADRPYLKPVVDAASNIWNLYSQSLADETNFQRFVSMRQGFNETGARMFRWRKESSMEQIAQDLQKFFEKNKSPLANLTKVQQMQVVERSPGGRILKLAVQTDRGNIILEKDEIRSAFSAPRSTLFYLEPLFNRGKANKSALRGYAFVGGGLGHGVGLSQIGAYGLAKLGWTSDRILDFYYPGTQIQQLKL